MAGFIKKNKKTPWVFIKIHLVQLIKKKTFKKLNMYKKTIDFSFQFATEYNNREKYIKKKYSQAVYQCSIVLEILLEFPCS
jgi:hypothetical protein